MDEKNKHIVIKDDTVCTKCGKGILDYPFYYIPKKQRIIHLFCFQKEEDDIEEEAKLREKGELE